MKKRRKKAATRKGRTRAKNEYRVFVSHATSDKWIARKICEELESAGAKAFRDDRDIKGGDDIPDEIRAEIQRSNEFLLILTPESRQREWVLLELGAAWMQGDDCRIVIIMHHLGVESIPDVAKSKKAVPLNDLDAYLVELRQRVERMRK